MMKMSHYSPLRLVYPLVVPAGTEVTVVGILAVGNLVVDNQEEAAGTAIHTPAEDIPEEMELRIQVEEVLRSLAAMERRRQSVEGRI